jgi:dTDP-4-dehydrorhamnose 3,5-epimerase
MQSTRLAIPDVVVIEPSVFEDDRGSFFESWNRASFAKAVGAEIDFVQDNQSTSLKGVLRGLHYQADPQPQGKLVRVVAGSVWDVAVDIRRSSPSFSKWVGVELSDDNRLQLWIPPGFAHGFVALTDRAEVLYKVTVLYDRDLDRSIRWDDPQIGIDWPLVGEPTLSDKDAAAPYLGEADVFP